MRTQVTLVILALLNMSCLLSPTNQKLIPSRDSLISFKGYYPEKNIDLFIYVSKNPTGPWQLLRTGKTETTPIDLGNGTIVYFFDIKAKIPSIYWGKKSCDRDQTFAYVSTNSTLTSGLYTFDDEAYSGVDPIECLVENDFYPVPCASAERPIARILTSASYGPFNHVGDLTIDTQADIDEWGCLESLDGNLTITNVLDEDAEFKNLESISGALWIDYPLYKDEFGLWYNRTRNFPSLTHIGGDLTMMAPTPVSKPLFLDVDLNQVTSLEGGLSIQVANTANADFSGLTQLEAISGDLTLNKGETGEIFGPFLKELKSIGGDVIINGGTALLGLFPEVVTVQGDFMMDVLLVNLNNPPFSKLSSVGGDFTLSQVTTFSPNGTAFPNLGDIGGRMTLNLVEDIESIRLGAHPVHASALTLQSNPDLNSLSINDLQIDGSGSIEILNHPKLCTSAAEAFVSALPNHTGTVQIAGNLDC